MSAEASKNRRNDMNREKEKLRHLLPLDSEIRKNLSLLQVLHLVCNYIMKGLYTSEVCSRPHEEELAAGDVPVTMTRPEQENLTGFGLAVAQDGRLIYLTENVNLYLGHRMTEFLTHFSSFYEMVHPTCRCRVENLLQSATGVASGGSALSFSCMIANSVSSRRTSTLAADYKLVMVKGRFVTHANQPVFIAMVTPMLTPLFHQEKSWLTHEMGVFTTTHTVDMKIVDMSQEAEFYLNFNKAEAANVSWFNLIHPADLKEYADRFQALLANPNTDNAVMVVLRVKGVRNVWNWCNVVLFYSHKDENIRVVYQALPNDEAVTAAKEESLKYTGVNRGRTCRYIEEEQMDVDRKSHTMGSTVRMHKTSKQHHLQPLRDRYDSENSMYSSFDVSETPLEPPIALETRFLGEINFNGNQAGLARVETQNVVEQYQHPYSSYNQDIMEDSSLFVENDSARSSMASMVGSDCIFVDSDSARNSIVSVIESDTESLDRMSPFIRRQPLIQLECSSPDNSVVSTPPPVNRSALGGKRSAAEPRSEHPPLKKTLTRELSALFPPSTEKQPLCRESSAQFVTWMNANFPDVSIENNDFLADGECKAPMSPADSGFSFQESEMSEWSVAEERRPRLRGNWVTGAVQPEINPWPTATPMLDIGDI